MIECYSFCGSCSCAFKPEKSLKAVLRVFRVKEAINPSTNTIAATQTAQIVGLVTL